jgi:hypothetical protein
MGYNTASVRKLNSFAEAKKWYENIKPIARHPQQVRPLGIRRHHEMASIRMPDSSTVELYYYRNPLVTWRSDNTFSVHAPAYWSAFVPDNIHNFVPLNLGFGWNRGRLLLRVGNEFYAMERGQSYNFQMMDGGKCFFLNVPTAYATRIRRKPYAEAMKKVSKFKDWFNIVNAISETHKGEAVNEAYEIFRVANGVPSESQYDKLRGNLVYSANRTEEEHELVHRVWDESRKAGKLPFRGNRQHSNQYADFHRPSCEMLFNWITDESGSKWTEALYVILQQQGGNKNYGSNFDRHMFISHRALDDYLSALVKYLFRDQVFEKVRLDQGAIPTKTNLNFYDEIEFTIGNIDIMSINPNPKQGA